MENQGTPLHLTQNGMTLCPECGENSIHFDLIDGWIYAEDPVAFVVLDGSSDLIFCDGCNSVIEERR